MIVSERVRELTEARAQRLPGGLPKRKALEYEERRPEDLTPATMAHRAAFLPRGGGRPTETELERLIGTNDLVDEFYLERALLSATPVCRISIRAASGRERGAATGFMISPRLLITNEHVFSTPQEAQPSLIEFNYKFDVAGRPETSYLYRLRPDLFFFNDPDLDFAVVSVEPASLDGHRPLASFGYHRLIPQSGKSLPKEWLTIIQHPGGARRQFAIRENQCISTDDPDVVWYMSDTSQGSSGSPVLNDSFQVVALHHSGVARQDPHTGRYVLKNGRQVSDLDEIDDSEVDWIANAGIRVSRICASLLQNARENGGHLAELSEIMQGGGGDVLSKAYEAKLESIGETDGALSTITNATSRTGRLVLGTLVLDLSSGLLGSAVAPAVGASAQLPTLARPAISAGLDGEVETYKEPLVDPDYANRTGFDPDFLGLDAPLPLPIVEQALLAKMKPEHGGGTEILYEHFSVFLHAERKLAAFTATNVDGNPVAKKPEAGKSYTRKALDGFSHSEIEKWIIDPRLDEQSQIPDAFYTKDKGAFDRGHITRREDVCFGNSYAQVQRANGDTFHVTNCSPQRADFNRAGSLDEGIWGRLENFIGAQADEEKYCIFAGPVLDPADQTFNGTQAVQIPSRFWKVVCARKAQALQVFAFILSQDLAGVPLEFAVSAEWKPRQVTMRELEETIAIVSFPQIYHDADQAK